MSAAPKFTEIEREAVEEELRAWVEVFNSHTHPALKVWAIKRIRELRGKLRGLR